ncbi:MAG: TonB-dependent receptor [Chitinophagaceae bacterium]|nr:TonB-dependent receptor [Chitinophagaceae bacterium]
MRLTSLFVVICCSGLQLLKANTSIGQSLEGTTIQLELKNESLKKVFKKIENKTTFRFAYNNRQIEGYDPVNLSPGSYSVRNVIETALTGTRLGFRLVKNNIIIFETEDPSGSSNEEAVSVMADGAIRGKVINEKGEPVGGASILLVGTDKGVSADVNGVFVIAGIKPGRYNVQVSAIGFQNAERTVTVDDGQTLNIDFELKETSSSLSEVVVTGYSKQSKRDVTGAVSTISSDIVTKTPAADIGSVLQGRAAGVSVDAQGDPGSVAIVRIRGYGTNGNNDPLYVIDGVQMRGGNNLINPNDIESINILKDPSITSLYGAQGGNGVIVITTKSGKKGAPRLEYNSYASWEESIKYPQMLTPQGYADTYWGYLANSGLALSDQYYGSGNTPVLPDYIIERKNGAQLVAKEGDPIADPSLYDFSSYRILKTNKAGTDWWGAVLGRAFSQSHQLSLSGATDKSNYALSLGYLDNNGISAGTYFRRYSVRVNTEFSPAKWLRVGENIQFSYSQTGGVSGGNHNPQGYFADLYNRSPLIPMYDIAGNYSGPNGIVDSKAFHPGGNNPLLGLVNAKKNNGGFNSGFIGSAYIDIEPVKGLVFESKIGVQLYPYSFRYFQDTFPQNVYSPPYNSFTEGGGWSSDWRWTNKLSYDFRIKEIHKISAFVAYEARRAVSRYNSGTTPNLPYTFPAFLNLSNGAPVLNGGPYNTVSGYMGEESNLSAFGNVNYSLLDKYLFSFVIRRDGSSKFGPLNKYGIFPSYSAGWRISDEKFMDNISWINDLKVRAAVGSNGNDAIGYGLYLDQYNTNTYVSSYDLAGVNNAANTGVGLYQRGNPFIHWETNKSTNIGFDALLFKKLSISFSWFNRKTADLLGVPPASGLLGDALAPTENIMRFTNKGIELELGYNNNIGNLRYELNFNIATYRNNVDHINDDSAAHLDGNAYAPTHFALTRSVEGRPVSSFFGLLQTGIFQSGQEYTNEGVAYDGLDATNAAGHFKFKDISGPDGKPDGKIDENDRTFIGSPHPKFTYGFNLNLYYKNFDLGVFIQGVQGNDIFNYWRVNSVWPGALGEGSQDTWTPANTNAKLPIWNSNSSYDKNPSSFFVEDGSYLRIKNVQIGYTFSGSKAFNRLRAYVQGYNLFTITKYTGIDPEINAGSATTAGVDFGGNYPIARKIVVGVNFGL